MAASPIFLTLQGKKQLTHDVYELEYRSEAFSILPGQFLLCDTSGDPKLKRSYSVSWVAWKSVFFIIKRVSDGTGGSVAICDQPLGYKMQVWWPLGWFLLQDTPCPKVFIGTGTGFAPLYFQMRAAFEKNQEIPLFFLFGVRELRDIFYLEEMKKWSESSSFDYQIYCSRENGELPEKHHHGRITEYLTSETLSQLNQSGDTEFYICWSPAMVTEVRWTLDEHGIRREKVFFEQY